MNNFNPSTFYISIIDLFAILLPGSLVSIALYHLYKSKIDSLLKIGTEEHTTFHMAFILLFASYLFGHIISQISAYLDEWVYDILKEKVYKDDKRVKKVMHIREKNYSNAMDPVYVNTFKWSIYKLQKDYKEAAAEVDRYMADSKFFRSLFVVLLAGLFVLAFVEQRSYGYITLSGILVFIIMNILYDSGILGKTKSFKNHNEGKSKKNIVRQLMMILTFLLPLLLLSYQAILWNFNLGLACSLLAAFSMVRYFKKRRKATETAYQYIIFLEELNTPA